MALGTYESGGTGSGGAGPNPTQPPKFAASNIPQGGSGISYGGSADSAGGFNQRSPATSGLSQLLRQLSNQFAPDSANMQSQGNSLMDQIRLATQQGNVGAGRLNTDYGLQMQGLGLDSQGRAISSQALARQLANNTQQERLMRALNDNQQKQLGSQYNQDLQQTRSTATANGAFSAPGFRNDQRNLYGDLGLGIQQSNLGLQKDLLGLHENSSSLRDQQRMLGLDAQRAGLTADGYKHALHRALTDLGLSTSLNVNDLYSQLGQLGQSGGQARQIIDQLLQYSQQLGGR